ncbi:hypothetical protein CXT76_00830 [Candidatus Parvarchaeota archaeon]|jgi:leucyl aminopeptidase (aminopeptidase T)|nr:MAG: hypothetical protein CXT76_00830 [Candidatus Parvarchaeota archaeon]HIG52216.1 hypothetical protein [Candidatus Pacearchaeota archaeon]
MIKTIKRGAIQAVKNCMQISEKDYVVIITDKATQKVASEIEKESKKITTRVKLFVLEDYGKRPLKKFPEEIKESLKNSTASFYMAEINKGEKNVLRKPLMKFSLTKGRQAHMPNITAKLMRQGMNTDYKKIKKISKKVYKIVSKAKKIKVSTKKGTNLVATFNSKNDWIIADGDIKNSPVKLSNLPDGEVFTTPGEVNGTAVVDGCIGDYFIKLGKLKHPIIVKIKKNKVESIKTKNKSLEKKLRKYIKQDQNACKIGEFAIGTNIGLKKIVGNLLQDEKFPGIHIALGDCLGEFTKAKKCSSKAHLDMVITKTNIEVDGKEIMRNGKFIKSILK